MQLELKNYYRTGDYQPYIETLCVSDKKATLIALQGCIQRSVNIEERNALEDIAFIVSHDGQPLLPKQALIKYVKKRAISAYGEHVGQFVDIAAMVTGITAGFIAPPVNAMVAAIGIEAEKKVSNISVTNNDCAEKIILFGNSCETCGGREVGAGHIYCHHCLAKVMEPFRDIDIGNHLGIDSEIMARVMLDKHSSDFGCSACSHKPVQVCGCQKNVYIPKTPRHGEILKGRYSKSNEPWFCCIHLEEE